MLNIHSIVRMSVQDFVQHFDELELCHLSPDLLTDKQRGMVSFSSSSLFPSYFRYMYISLLFVMWSPFPLSCQSLFKAVPVICFQLEVIPRIKPKNIDSHTDNSVTYELKQVCRMTSCKICWLFIRWWRKSGSRRPSREVGSGEWTLGALPWVGHHVSCDRWKGRKWTSGFYPCTSHTILNIKISEFTRSPKKASLSLSYTLYWHL